MHEDRRESADHRDACRHLLAISGKLVLLVPGPLMIVGTVGIVVTVEVAGRIAMVVCTGRTRQPPGPAVWSDRETRLQPRAVRLALVVDHGRFPGVLIL